MKIGIVGNRTGWTYDEVKKQLSAFFVSKTDTIISGGAEGVDTFAQMYAKEIGAEIIILYPDPQKPSPQRYFDRNYEIACKCDCLIAFQRNPYKSGTQSTINAVKRLGKKALVFGEDGKLFSGGESPEKVRVAEDKDDERFAEGELKPEEAKRWIDAKVLHKDDSPCGHEIIQIGKTGFCPVCMDNQKPQSCPVCGTVMKKGIVHEIPNMEITRTKRES
jgi:hypothetical protein